ncbi:MAG: RDD family protein [Phycisphaerales bacterium]
MIARRLLILGATLLAAAVAHAADLGVASSRTQAWALLEIDEAARSYKRLYHIPCDGTQPFGQSIPGPTLPSGARLLCAVDERLLFIQEPEGLQDPSQPVITRVRETGVVRIEGPVPYDYTQPRALAHIPEGSVVIDATGYEGDAWLLARVSEARVALLRLDRGSWTSVASFEPADNERQWLRAIGGTLGIIRSSGAAHTFWTVDTATGELAPSQTFTAPNATQFVGIGGRLVTLLEAGDAMDIAVLFEGRTPAPIATVPRHAKLFNAGGNAGAAWINDNGAIASTIVSLSGVELFSGTLNPRPIIRPQDFQVLGLVLVSALLTMVFFIWRPYEKSAVVKFPAGVAIADPSRRATAWGIDLVLSALASAGFWSVGLDQVLLLGPVGPLGVIPTVSAIALFVAHTTIGEATLGRSLGKALCRVRVIGPAGRPPSFGRSLLRNFIRGMCPTLGFALLMGPVVREPWACGTWVVMSVDGQDSPTDPDEQPSQSDRESGSD